MQVEPSARSTEPHRHNSGADSSEADERENVKGSKTPEQVINHQGRCVQQDHDDGIEEAGAPMCGGSLAHRDDCKPECYRQQAEGRMDSTEGIKPVNFNHAASLRAREMPLKCITSQTVDDICHAVLLVDAGRA